MSLMPVASSLSSATLDTRILSRFFVITHMSCTMALMGLTMLCRSSPISSATSARQPATHTHRNTLRLFTSRIMRDTGTKHP